MAAGRARLNHAMPLRRAAPLPRVGGFGGRGVDVRGGAILRRTGSGPADSDSQATRIARRVRRPQQPTHTPPTWPPRPTHCVPIDSRRAARGQAQYHGSLVPTRPRFSQRRRRRAPKRVRVLGLYGRAGLVARPWPRCGKGPHCPGPIAALRAWLRPAGRPIPGPHFRVICEPAAAGRAATPIDLGPRSAGELRPPPAPRAACGTGGLGAARSAPLGRRRPTQPL